MTDSPVWGGNTPPPGASGTQSRAPKNAHPDFNPYGDGRCPECGIDLSTVDPAKHSIAHYGVDPIQFDARTAQSTLLARQRQASLVGQPLPEK